MRSEIILQLDHQFLLLLRQEARAKRISPEELLEDLIEQRVREPRLNPQVRRVAEKLGEQYLKQVEEQWHVQRTKSSVRRRA